MRRLWVLLFLLWITFCEAKPPQLTAHDTRVKVKEILKAHVSHQKLTPALVQRALLNYIEELDAGKIYFIEAEIAEWLEPSEALLETTLQGYDKEDFTTFSRLHEVMVKAIERRNELEATIDVKTLKTGSQAIDFKTLKWTKSEEELKERLIHLKSMQLGVAEKLDQDPEQFFKRLTKYRLMHEQNLQGSSPAERQKEIFACVLKATSSALDSQTAYFTPTEATQFMMQVQQRLFGIGAHLRDDLTGFSIVRLLEDGPALIGNKLKVGDRIIAVDQEPVVGMDILEAVEKIRGPQGTKVLLTILRTTDDKEEKLDVEIVRGEVVIKEARWESTLEPYGDGMIATLHLYSFYQDGSSSSTEDLAKAIEKFKKEYSLKGVILDLRNNPGGFLPQAAGVAGLFLGKGVIVSVKHNTGDIQRLRNIEGKPIWEGPLVVLTNRASASASEIVAQTLKEYGRAIIIGDDTTFGKGTFQTFTMEAANHAKVNPKGEYKVTRGCYYTVSGKSPQLIGVPSDIVIPGSLSQMEIGEKFSKYPLEDDTIAAAFDDDLSDIPIVHRAQVARLYKFNLQPVLNTYEAYLSTLKKNSEDRVAQNKNYQIFLKELNKKEGETPELFGQSDLQLDESLNVMKDLIFLMQKSFDMGK